jgi:hypothetical protein
MADNDKLNTFLTQLAEFDPGTLDALSFTREQFGDVFGSDTFGQLFNPLAENTVRDTGKGLNLLRGGGDVGSLGLGVDPQQFFASLLQSDDDLQQFGREGIVDMTRADASRVQELIDNVNRFLGQRGLGSLSEIRRSLQDRLGLLDEEPFQTTNEITEQNPLGQSPFARTPTAQPTTPGNTAANVRNRNLVIQEGRDALRQLQAVPASQLGEEERRRREIEVERQTLERRKTLGSKPSVGSVSVPSRVSGVRTDLGKVV